MPDLGRAGELIEAAVESGGIPGAVAMAGRGPVTLGTWVAGHADTTPGAVRPMRAGTVFDLASLTKIVATTTTALAMTAAGELGLDVPVSRYLPEFRAGPVTIRHLLAHTSGLPASRQFYQWCADRQELLRDLFSTVLQAPPGARVAYSDPGFIVLGETLARVAGEPLDAAVRRLVLAPLGMTRTGYNPAGSPGPLGAGRLAVAGQLAGAGRFAATERRGDGGSWTGVVHDENARLMGGVAGHAGLFATAADLARFAAWWVSDQAGPVPAALRRQAESGQAPQGRRGLGWAGRGDPHDILGEHWPPSAVSHTGFTGTSLALDSHTGVWVVLLTNGVHFGRDATAVKALRHSVHTAVARAMFSPPPA